MESPVKINLVKSPIQSDPQKVSLKVTEQTNYRYQPNVLIRKLNIAEHELRECFEKNQMNTQVTEIKTIEKTYTEEDIEPPKTIFVARQLETLSRCCGRNCCCTVKQFQCYVCALEFKLEGTLTLHLEKVHQIFEEKDQLQDKNDVATPPKDFSGSAPLSKSRPEAPKTTTFKKSITTSKTTTTPSKTSTTPSKTPITPAKTPVVTPLKISRTPRTASVKAAKEIASIVTAATQNDFQDTDQLSDYKPDSDKDSERGGGGFSDGYNSDNSGPDWIEAKIDIKEEEPFQPNCQLDEQQVDLDEDDKPLKRSKLNLKSESESGETKPRSSKSRDMRKKRKKRPRKEKTSFQCSLCDQVFQVRTEYTLHLRQEHGRKTKPFHCKSCRSKFSQSYLLESHIAEVHDGKKVYACKHCQLTFDTRQKQDYHVRNMHESGPNVKCQVCDVQHPEVKMQFHLTTVHTAEESVKCEFCEKIYTNRFYYGVHMKRFHEQKKATIKAMCPQCGKLLDSDKGLQIHIKFVHEKQYNFVCETCNQKCSKPCELRRHIEVVHKGIKRYSCDQCDYKCTTTSYLLAHKSAKHGESLPFCCEICAKSFPTNTLYKIHVKKDHEKIRHKCPECGKEFGVKESMMRHVQAIHQGLKPHKCPECEMAFGMKHSMRRHLKSVHSGVKQTGFSKKINSSSMKTNGSSKTSNSSVMSKSRRKVNKKMYFESSSEEEEDVDGDLEETKPELPF